MRAACQAGRFFAAVSASHPMNQITGEMCHLLANPAYVQVQNIVNQNADDGEQQQPRDAQAT